MPNYSNLRIANQTAERLAGLVNIGNGGIAEVVLFSIAEYAAQIGHLINC